MNMKRLGNLLKADFLSLRINLFFPHIMMILLFIIFFSLGFMASSFSLAHESVLTGFWQYYFLLLPQILWLLSLFVGSIGATYAFSPKHKHFFFSLPASLEEKLFSRWFLTGIGQFFALTVTFFILYGISYLFVSSHGDPVLLKNIIFEGNLLIHANVYSIFIMMISYLWIHSTFLYLSNAFSNLRLIKSIILVSIWNVCYVFLFISFAFYAFLYTFLQNIEFIYVIVFFMKHINTITYFVSFLWIGFFLYGTYVELKRLPL